MYNSRGDGGQSCIGARWRWTQETFVFFGPAGYCFATRHLGSRPSHMFWPGVQENSDTSAKRPDVNFLHEGGREQPGLWRDMGRVGSGRLLLCIHASPW